MSSVREGMEQIEPWQVLMHEETAEYEYEHHSRLYFVFGLFCATLLSNYEDVPAKQMSTSLSSWPLTRAFRCYFL